MPNKKISDKPENAQDHFDKWWEKATKKGAKYMVDFGCQHAFLAGWSAANRNAIRASKPKKGGKR